MALPPVTRKLAAILACDVVGYSRLMGADEAGTHARLRALCHDLVEPSVAAHGGRIFKTAGDGMMIEFASAVDAVRHALAVQDGIVERNAGTPADKRMELRMGINLGDVIVEGEDVFGEGVNVAARIEAFAEPGQICLSEDVWRQVRGKVEATFDDLGSQTLKNIAEPVRIFRVRAMDGGPQARKGAALPLPAKPSIAILPLENLSGEAEQEFFADGITEDIITELSRFPELFVIARNSTFVYKGKHIKVQEVGRELGVHYAVEGSVRKAGNRVRITVQLIDAESGAHIWANRYDREIADIFELQDEIACTVAATISGRAAADYASRVIRKPPENMAAYDYVLAAKVLHHRGTAVDNAEALRLVERAIAADPAFAVAHAWKVCILGQAWQRGYGEFETLYPVAEVELRTAIALDPNDLEANRVLCEANMANNRLEDAKRHHDRAYAANPNDPRIVAQKGELLTWLGRPAEGADWVRAAMRLDPYETHVRAHLLGRALYAQGLYRDAAEAFAANPEPPWRTRAEHAAALAQAGDTEGAKAQAAALLRDRPSFSAAALLALMPFARAEDRERLVEGLAKAGLPA